MLVMFPAGPSSHGGAWHGPHAPREPGEARASGRTRAPGLLHVVRVTRDAPRDIAPLSRAPTTVRTDVDPCTRRFRAL